MTTAVQDKGAVIVTGASRGIGAAIAERLADDGYGVIVNYSADAKGAESVVSAIKAKGGRATAVRADVASEDDVVAMFDQARQMGPLTALVNNAGIGGEQGRFDEQQADKLTRLMQVNVVGSIVCAKHAVRAMSTARGGKGGSIVTIASIAAKAPVGTKDAPVPYDATKGALVSFARGLSNEVAAEGVRSNSVSPGVIDTELASSPQLRDYAANGPMGRIGRPDEIAATVSWLISPESSYVTGSDITVSGGI
jgi:NAD(P)-dependent dehydrogenase (short-subunit alcohol dehydrogenase family)